MAKKIPVRQCIGCGEKKSKKELIRIVKTPEGAFCVDATGRKNGRGAYLCNDIECLKKARKSHALERSFEMQIPGEVYDKLEEELIHGEIE
ncbi:MAG: YlxR family protein [Lachnospiraceae bacterium]|nr:YlxR family protein [Lachnospiraceae bacterium]